MLRLFPFVSWVRKLKYTFPLSIDNILSPIAPYPGVKVVENENLDNNDQSPLFTYLSGNSSDCLNQNP